MTMEESESILCPFCGYKADSDYQILLHLAEQHPEDGEPSPFTVKDDASIAAILSCDDDIQYAECPLDGCGEAIPLTELDSHMEMHGIEQDVSTAEAPEGEGSGPPSKRKRSEDDTENSFSTKLSHALRNVDEVEVPRQSERDQQVSAKSMWKNILRMPETAKNKVTVLPPAKSGERRLGKKELGPYANEKQMPPWLLKLLHSDGETKIVMHRGPDGRNHRLRVCPNRAEGVMPVLKQLLTQDRSTQYAYLCHPSVRHVSKIDKEGGFCGYRNTQMLCSYIIAVESQGHELFKGKIPSIFDIQEYIETAWDFGINAAGRIETGGIRGTRKYIGTPDVQAMLQRLEIACNATAYKSVPGKSAAHDLLFNAVEAYFSAGTTSFDPKVRLTSLPPLYFQHPGHSMTIVGFEKRRDGSKNLICFDPMFKDAPNILKQVGNTFDCREPSDWLKAYRRGMPYLKRHKEFEMMSYVACVQSSLFKTGYSQ